MGMMNDIAAGTIGGLAGGMAMTGVRLLSRQAGVVGDTPPMQLEHWGEDRLGVAEQTGPEQESNVGLMVHLAFSAVLGAGYGALRSAFHLRAMPAGTLYGLGI